MPPSILHLLFPSSSLSSYLIQTPETSSPLKCERCRKNTHSQHTHRHTTKEGGKLGRDCLTWRWTPEQTRRESKIGETKKHKGRRKKDVLTKESQTHSALLFDTDCRLQKEFQKMFFYSCFFSTPQNICCGKNQRRRTIGFLTRTLKVRLVLRSELQASDKIMGES